jgi:hypothetical protein
LLVDVRAGVPTGRRRLVPVSRDVAAVATLLVGLVGCAVFAPPAAVPPVPSQGGPAWLELTTDHFVVWTDASPSDADELVRVMEHLRQVVYGVSFFRPTSAGKTFVIGLRNIEEVHAYVPPQFIAYAMGPQNPLRQPVIVLPVDHLENDRRIITHELTHAISYTPLPVQPHWFAEGLAGYFETLRLDERRGKADVGVALDFRVRRLRTDHPLPLRALFACDIAPCMTDRYYDTTWLLFTFLMNQHPSELIRYVRALAELDAGATAPTWETVVPELPADQLDGEMARWLAYGSIVVRQYDVNLHTFNVAKRTLGDADAYAARAMLHGVWRPTPEPPEIQQALSADPSDVIANVLRASRDRDVTPDVARKVADAHPDDWRAWWLVEHAAHGGPEARDARAKMCALAQKDAAMLPRLACAMP